MLGTLNKGSGAPTDGAWCSKRSWMGIDDPLPRRGRDRSPSELSLVIKARLLPGFPLLSLPGFVSDPHFPLQDKA